MATNFMWHVPVWCDMDFFSFFREKKSSLRRIQQIRINRTTDDWLTEIVSDDLTIFLRLSHIRIVQQIPNHALEPSVMLFSRTNAKYVQPTADCFFATLHHIFNFPILLVMGKNEPAEATYSVKVTDKLLHVNQQLLCNISALATRYFSISPHDPRDQTLIWCRGWWPSYTKSVQWRGKVLCRKRCSRKSTRQYEKLLQ